MATTTSKLGLTKPAYTDIVDVADLNDNADLLDAAVGVTICTSSTRPASPYDGQLIFETDSTDSFVWDGSAWQPAGGGGGSITVSETAPTSPAPGNGDLWFSSTDGRTFVYYEDVDGSQWVEIGQVLGGGGGASVTVDATAPASPSNGDLWWDTDNGNLYIYYTDADSSQWVAANGPQVFVGTSAPAGYQGQLWFDSTDGKTYIYYDDGTSGQWVSAIGGSLSGNVIQVVSTTKTDTFSTTSATPADVTGLSVSITPTSTSSKIYVVATAYIGNSAGYTMGHLARDGSVLVTGTGGSTYNGGAVVYPGDSGVNYAIMAMPMQFLDAPASTSALTYSVQINSETTSHTSWVNRRNANATFGATSSITVMEIAG